MADRGRAMVSPKLRGRRRANLNVKRDHLPRFARRICVSPSCHTTGGPLCAGVSRSGRCLSRARWPAAMSRGSPRRARQPDSRTSRQGSDAVGRRRTGARGRCLLFDGHGRTRDPARGLCAGDRLQGISAGAQGAAERQDRHHLFRMGGLQRPEDHHSLAGDRRPGNRRRGRRRNHEDAGAPGLAHLDLGRDQFRHAAVRARIPIAASGA